MNLRRSIGATVALLASFSNHAETLLVGVASNFSTTFKQVQTAYENQSDHRLVELSGSSGKLFAQIHHGAPIDVFLAADSQRPRQLEQQNLAEEGSRFTYAIGRLAMWSAAPDTLVNALSLDSDFKHLAIANPTIAPYGRAAEEVLTALGLQESVRGRIVRGESASQAMHYAASGNAEFAFVALAQANQLGGSYWLVPQSLHQPIEQQAVVIRQSTAANDFIGFLKSAEAKKILHDTGYIQP